MSGLEQFMAFAATARHGSFAAAAREQGAVPSTLAKAVGRLEADLGVKLFHRTTRQVRLSPDGERLFERCQRVLAEIDELRAEASGARHAATGELLVSAPVLYGKRFVLPVLAGLLQRHPALQLEVRLSDQYLDLVRERIDVAVRIGHLRDSSLVARRIDQQSLVLCASPAYLAAHGVPRRLDELQRHSAIAFRLPSTGRDRAWQFRHRGTVIEVPPKARLRINETESVLEAIRLGLGLCQLPENVVADQLASGEIVEVLPSCRPPPMPINVVVASGRLMPARVRLAIEALETLRARAGLAH